MQLFLTLVALAWLMIVLVTYQYHEFWRDEVRALSVSLESPSFWGLPAFIKNEGHPVAWYALLRTGYKLTGSAGVLPIISIMIAAGAVLLFLFRSPFSLGVKLLFVFSILPLYLYSVMARNYGISMLTMFSFAALYPYKKSYPWALAVILAVLSNTNVHSLLLAASLMCLWLYDEMVVERECLSAHRLCIIGLCAALVLTAGLFSLHTAMPDERSIASYAYNSDTEGAAYYIAAFLDLFRHPFRMTLGMLLPYTEGTGVILRIVQFYLLAGLVLGLAVKPALMLAAAFVLVAMGYFFSFAYMGELRHQGLLLTFIISLYWIYGSSESVPKRGTLEARLHVHALILVLPLVLLWDDYLAANYIRDDIRNEVSSSKALGSWLAARPQYQQAIIIGEPDFYLEALPYYSPQRLYIPRESRFGNYVRFVTSATPVMSVAELLARGKELKQKENSPVLIALGVPPDAFDKRSSYSYSYNKTLTWTPREWEQFKANTDHQASFWEALTDEKFDLYEIR